MQNCHEGDESARANDLKHDFTASGIKGRISISDFIKDVENELFHAQATAKRPCFELGEVTLEVSFSLDASARGGTKLFVLEMGGEAKAQQLHKVTLKLKPLSAKQVAAVEALRSIGSGDSTRTSQTGSSGGGYGLRSSQPNERQANSQIADEDEAPRFWFAPAVDEPQEDTANTIAQPEAEIRAMRAEVNSSLAEAEDLLSTRENAWNELEISSENNANALANKEEEVKVEVPGRSVNRVQEDEAPSIDASPC